MLFFALHKTRKMDRYRKLWSFVICGALMPAIGIDKSNLFRSDTTSGEQVVDTEKAIEFEWHASFNSLGVTAKVVQDVFDKLEAVSSHDSQSAASEIEGSHRSDRQDGSESAFPVKQLRIRAIEEARFRWMQQLNYGRNRVRRFL